MTHLQLDPWTGAPLLDGDADAALATAAAGTPEAEPWLRLLRAALAAADAPVWRNAELRFARARPAAAPLMHDARVLVDGSATVVLVEELLGARGVAAADAVAFITAGIRQRTTTGDWPARYGVDAGAARAAAHFAALPLLLQACARASSLVPDDWTAGYCPVCGAWPALAELRGLERRRILRCGRCAAGWVRDVLVCTYCGERDHRRQGALVPHEGGELVRLETCASCRGYLKCVTTLRAKPAWAIPLDDLRLLPLELKALEQGWRRPDAPGWRVALHVAPHPIAQA